MRLLQPIFIFTFLLASIVSATTHVAVLETISEKGVIGRSEKMFLTDELRKRANVILPEYMGFVVMTRENINAMLPPGKTMEDCEGTCLVETGKNISADYVAQARVGKFGKQLTLTMELYETAENKLVGSFTARKPDAEGLLEEIEREADAVFQKILGTGVTTIGGSEGISDISTGSGGYRATGIKSYIVRVESSPTGAMFSTDGRINAKCNKTPCDITLPAGSHRFSFSMDMYFDKDETIDVKKNGQTVLAILAPNFGELTLTPIFEDYMGNLETAIVKIDGKEQKGNVHRLSAGVHKVQISHKCYETISFNAELKNGSKIIFDKRIQPLLGGLEINAEFEGKPKVVPVFVNGKKMGETPFLETVPVCSKVQIDNGKNDIPIKLKSNETIKFTYNGNSVLIDKRDGMKYKTTTIGNQTWMAENLNYKTEGSYCYDSKEYNCAQYGRLYTWTTKNLCPANWHLPSKDEFEVLIKNVGGKTSAGKELKSTSGWSNQGNGNGIWGFAAKPGGYRRNMGGYEREGSSANFWSSTGFENHYAYSLWLTSNLDEARLNSELKGKGFSVRCVKNN